MYIVFVVVFLTRPHSIPQASPKLIETLCLNLVLGLQAQATILSSHYLVKMYTAEIVERYFLNKTKFIFYMKTKF